ncbi:DsbA family protein [Tranquillimonas alkanivorans]|uniref:Protein-disulfide isomerase n=1 Tax=Tranquillimonas alkanivorans TaxID=441119 RepID=A0A1I5UDN8_9RHOB|nr:DsbA family protein [Tranquillimonas alkanivorans]SFP93127.1 Protein-disulfide isomerase [Tranquillimonas alkanivorans]
MTRLNRRHLLLGGLATAGSAAGLLLFSRNGATAQDLTREDVLFDPDNPELGNPEGDVTLVEFFDYQCPYCKANHPILTDVVAADGNIRLVMKDWPIFGAPSVRAAQLALGAASLDAYETANATLMATEGRLDDALIDEALEDAGLDVADLQAAYQNDRNKWDGLIARNGRQASILGLRGTPAFIVGTALYPGAMDGEALREAIEMARS